MSRNVWTNRSSIDLMSFENRPMIFLFLGSARSPSLRFPTVQGRKPPSPEWVPGPRSRAAAAPESEFQFPSQFLLATQVARREMKRDDASRLGGAADRAGLRRREMPALGGQLGIRLQESGLDEQRVGVTCERRDPPDI